MGVVTKSERVAFRFTPENRRRLEMAAELRGQTLTAFVEAAVAEKASEVLEQFSRIELSLRDARAVHEALSKPPAPSEPLRRAAERHLAFRDEHPELNW
jgi:uncharacterized protein (DUF1778 family)